MEKEIKEVICTTCPLGCKVFVTMIDGKILDIKGNTCSRGKVYAENEVIRPMRTLTSTVKTDSGIMIPVKTNKAVDKKLLLDCMKELNGITVKLPIKIGEILIENIANSGADLVACKNAEKPLKGNGKDIRKL